MVNTIRQYCDSYEEQTASHIDTRSPKCKVCLEARKIVGCCVV